MEIYREITPLTTLDCFTIFSRKKRYFDFPLHTHSEFELNLIINGKGVKRIVGDSIEIISGADLSLVGSNLPHGWFDHDYKWVDESNDIIEITIQFHADLLDDNFLKRQQLYFIKSLLEHASRGIAFSEETATRVYPKLIELSKKTGFDSVLELLSILHDLSISRNYKLLSTTPFSEGFMTMSSRRLDKVFSYMRDNYQKDITLEEVAKLAGMTEVSFSRFIKKRTGKTFIDSLNEIRLGNATRFLIETSYSIAEVAYKCGFNNLSYFNRIFKRRNGVTPKDFRSNYVGRKSYI